jgi:CheY-like chemotaxis protein
MSKILIVDDSKVDQKILSEILLSSEDRYDVRTVDSGEKALDIFKKEMFDIILLDVVLPGKDGLEIYKEILKQIGDKFLPVIFITEYPKGR